MGPQGAAHGPRGGAAHGPRGAAHGCPRAAQWDLEGRCMDLKGLHHWTLTGGAMGPRGAVHGPQGAAPPLKVLLAPHEVPGRQTLRPKLSSLGGFWAPTTKTSYNTPHHNPKFEV